MWFDGVAMYKQMTKADGWHFSGSCENKELVVNTILRIVGLLHFERELDRCMKLPAGGDSSRTTARNAGGDSSRKTTRQSRRKRLKQKLREAAQNNDNNMHSSVYKCNIHRGEEKDRSRSETDLTDKTLRRTRTRTRTKVSPSIFTIRGCNSNPSNCCASRKENIKPSSTSTSNPYFPERRRFEQRMSRHFGTNSRKGGDATATAGGDSTLTPFDTSSNLTSNYREE